MFCAALLLLQLLSVMALRPSQLVTEVKVDEVPPKTLRKILTIKPGGRIGVHFDIHSGILRKVWHGSQAEKLGLEPGDRIAQINGEAFAWALWEKAYMKRSESSVSFEITVLSMSETQRKVLRVLWYVSAAAGIIGLFLVLSIPWMIHLSSGLDDRGKAFSNHPVFLFMVTISVASVVGKLLERVVEGFYSGWGQKIFPAGRVTLLLAVTGGCFANRRNPLLSSPLSKDLAALCQKRGMVALVLWFASALFEASAATSESGPWSDRWDPLDFFYDLSDILDMFLLLIFALLSLRISVAARQEMDRVTQALPCDKAEFVDRVHKPCSDLMQDVPPKLLSCGLPLLLLSICLVLKVLEVYARFVGAVKQLSWKMPFGYEFCASACELLATLWAVALPLAQLSSALRHLKMALSQARQDDPALHLEVQSVKTMLKKARDQCHECSKSL